MLNLLTKLLKYLVGVLKMELHVRLDNDDVWKLGRLARRLNCSIRELAAAALKGLTVLGGTPIEGIVKDLAETDNPVMAAFTRAILGYWNFYEAFEKTLLEDLGCAGHYMMMDMEVDFRKGRMELIYHKLGGSPLLVDVFVLALEGLSGPVELEAGHYLGFEVSEERLRKVSEGAKARSSLFRRGIKREVRLDHNMLVFKFKAENLEELPSIPEISEEMDNIISSARE